MKHDSMYEELATTSERAMKNANSDCWKDRKKGMVCSTCIFFVEKTPLFDYKSIDMPVDSRGRFGRCRHNAPTIKGFVPGFESDWCGEHRLDENKL